MTAAAPPPKTLVSFDIDGTLIRSAGADANALHKAAFAAALKHSFGLDTTIDVVPHSGSTDPLILLAVLDHHGVERAAARAALPAMQDAMVAHYLAAGAAAAAAGLEVLPGVRELLAALAARGDVATCLVTGNLEPIGWAKMAALGLEEHFTRPVFGGFGGCYCSGDWMEMGWRDRAEFLRIAARRAGVPLGRRFHLGDAPMDVRAAAAAGAHPVGLTTGIYSEAELKRACPEATVLDDLSDLDAVLRVLGLANSTGASSSGRSSSRTGEGERGGAEFDGAT
jgi:phosphoglycolate phosphatase-like HAD superfamily hydrolase